MPATMNKYNPARPDPFTRNFLREALSGEAARNCGQVWRNACETTHSEGGFWGEAVRM